jgi:hypothetical protein
MFQFVLLILLFTSFPRSVAEEPEAPRHWEQTFNLRTWSGYKDNVLLGNQQTVESPFLAGGADYFLWRMPSNGWDYTLFLTADYIRYLNDEHVDDETTVLAHSRLQKEWNEKWKSTAIVEYLFFDQVFDNSTFDQEIGSVQIQGQSLQFKPGVERRWNQAWRTGLELTANRQEFRALIDDYWELGPRVSVAREYGNRSELSFWYEWGRRIHDSRFARNRSGLALAGEDLEFDRQELNVQLKHHWDKQRRWRTSTRIGLERNTDNSSGYYDFWKPALSQQIRFQAETWQWQAGIRLSYYDYDVQPVEAGATETRERLTWLASIRFEKTIWRDFKAFAEFEHENATSNLALDEYRVNTVFAGFDWEF